MVFAASCLTLGNKSNVAGLHEIEFTQSWLKSAMTLQLSEHAPAKQQQSPTSPNLTILPMARPREAFVFVKDLYNDRNRKTLTRTNRQLNFGLKILPQNRFYAVFSSQ